MVVELCDVLYLKSQPCLQPIAWSSVSPLSLLSPFMFQADGSVVCFPFPCVSLCSAPPSPHFFNTYTFTLGYWIFGLIHRPVFWRTQKDIRFRKYISLHPQVREGGNVVFFRILDNRQESRTPVIQTGCAICLVTYMIQCLVDSYKAFLAARVVHVRRWLPVNNIQKCSKTLKCTWQSLK
jgi:hypothetical protein